MLLAMDKYEEEFYPEIYFGGFARCDGTIAFYTRVDALVGPGSVVVNFGCGRGQHDEDPVSIRRNLQCFKGRVGRVIGLDVDLVGQDNPTIDEFRALNPDQRWPIDDRSANLILCDCVIEHLPDPDLLFREASRVLVSCGYICIRTTNLLSYIGLAAKFVPNRWHASVLSTVQPARKKEDVFPTLYRCNTIRAVRRALIKYNFHSVVYGHDAGPGYLTFSKIAYAAGVVHQRIAPSYVCPMIMAFGQLKY
jgi:SAM-dependent methyltransferase